MTDIKKKFSNLIQQLYPFGFRQDAQMLASRTLAFITGYVFAAWMFPTVSLIFISHLGARERDGCALALAIYNLVGNSILLGVNFASDALLPQCFGGNKHKMGIIVQRATIIVIYACFPIWILMLNATYVLQYIEHDPYILEIVNEFLQIFILVIPFDGISAVLRMYIASTGRTRILIYIQMIGNVVNILSHYICLYHLNMGIRAAPVSIILAYISLVISSIIYIRFSSMYEETWYPITRECLQEWNIYLKLALPGVVLMILQSWSIELSVFFASPLGITSLSAQVVVQQMVLLLYMIMASIGDAGDVLIGEYLGANKPMQAANAKNVLYTLTGFQLIFNFIFILILHPWLPYLFNIEPDALQLARYGLLLAAVVGIFDGLNAVQTAIVKACGMQKYGAVFLFIGFWLVGLPLAVIFTYVLHMNIFGFWTGMIIGEALIDILQFTLILNFNWQTFSKQAEEHIRFSNPSIYSSNDSLSPSNANEHMKLLPTTTDENIPEYSSVPTQSNREEVESNETTSDESLFKLVGIKLLVLIPLVCLFVASFVNSFRLKYV